MATVTYGRAARLTASRGLETTLPFDTRRGRLGVQCSHLRVTSEALILEKPCKSSYSSSALLLYRHAPRQSIGPQKRNAVDLGGGRVRPAVRFCDLLRYLEYGCHRKAAGFAEDPLYG